MFPLGYLITCWQAATIRLPNCPGQPLFGLGNHDLQRNCSTGQVQIESKLISMLSQKLQTPKNIKNYGQIGDKTINIIWLINFTHIFCCSGKSVQTVLWPSLLDRATKKKGIAAACLLICYICLDYCVTIQTMGRVYSIVTHVEVWLFCCYLFHQITLDY